MTASSLGLYRLCLVTDDNMAAGRPLAALVQAAVDGGVSMVQLREKHRPTRHFLQAALAVRDVLRQAGVPLIINDRVDIALAVEADGVHVGQHDLPVEAVRRLAGPGMLIGLSITSDDDLRRPDALHADYLGVGPVFGQITKPDAAPPLGIEGLSRIRRLSSKPVLAIGGIGPDNAGSVVRAGADGVAVVSALMMANDPGRAAQALRHSVDEAVRGRLTGG